MYALTAAVEVRFQQLLEGRVSPSLAVNSAPIVVRQIAVKIVVVSSHGSAPLSRIAEFNTSGRPHGGPDQAINKRLPLVLNSGMPGELQPSRFHRLCTINRIMLRSQPKSAAAPRWRRRIKKFRAGGDRDQAETVGPSAARSMSSGEAPVRQRCRCADPPRMEDKLSELRTHGEIVLCEAFGRKRSRSGK